MSGTVKYVGKFTPSELPKFQRSQLDRAGGIALALQPAHKEMWNSFWPMQHCMNTVLLVAPAIRMAMEWDVRVAVGRVKVRSTDRSHGWVATPAGDIIDPTYGMFAKGPVLRVLPAAEAGLLGHDQWVVLSLDHEEHFRRALQVETGDKGWDRSSGINQLFNMGLLPGESLFDQPVQ